MRAGAYYAAVHDPRAWIGHTPTGARRATGGLSDQLTIWGPGYPSIQVGLAKLAGKSGYNVWMLCRLRASNLNNAPVSSSVYPLGCLG